MKKLISAIIAAAVAMSLSGCASEGETAVTADVAENTVPAVTEDVIPETLGTEPTDEDALPDVGIVGYLDGLGLLESVTAEDPGAFEFDTAPVELYSVGVAGGSVSIKRFATEEAAAEEASKYDPDDPSIYGGAILEYTAPVYLWRDGDEIIELATFDHELAETFRGYCGEPFSCQRDVPETIEAPHEDITEPKEPPEFAFAAEIGNGSGFNSALFDSLPEAEYVADENSLAELTKKLADASSGEVDGLEEAFSRYDGGYFEDGALVVLALYEPTVSRGHRLLSAEYDGGTVTLGIENSPTGDEAEDRRIMIIEVKNKPGDAPKIRVVRSDAEAVMTEGFGAEYVRVDGEIETGVFLSGGEAGECAVITSRKELEDYYAGISGKIFRPDAFEEAMERYPADWFGGNTLIILSRTASSGSVRFEVTDVDFSNGGVRISLTTLIPEICTDDEAAWQIMVEVYGKKLPADTEVKIDAKTLDI